jgi:HlyD family secretion protein
VDDARAALSTDVTNLSKASIRSPIDGVVLTRTVEPGNAVAASLQAVTLFTLAEDLTRLRLDVSVDEADVGSVKLDQKASFTVSAYPSRRYPAKVTRVSFGSTKTDNVVTYITWLEVDNSDLSLRPGMTAAATITSTERNDVLLVPNTALRFTPAVAAGAAAQPAACRAAASCRARCRRCACARARAGLAGGMRQTARADPPVWCSGWRSAAVNVQGISDGRKTESAAKAWPRAWPSSPTSVLPGRAMSEAATPPGTRGRATGQRAPSSACAV